MAGQETAELLAQSGGKHGDGTLHQVHASSTLTSVAVQSGVGLDEVRNVGDMDTDVVCAILVDLYGNCIVEILGRVGVDSECTLSAKILTNFKLAVGDTRDTASVKDSKGE